MIMSYIHSSILYSDTDMYNKVYISTQNNYTENSSCANLEAFSITLFSTEIYSVLYISVSQYNIAERMHAT